MNNKGQHHCRNIQLVMHYSYGNKSIGILSMPRLDEHLLRKRCEHNDCQIGSLEEVSLHQEDLEKLEHLQHWCKDLKILLLHSNLISKIENIGKLKKLEYINLSLNNIERIENLEGCESLEKLDLTANFIGELTSVENLKKNAFLEQLYLTGNPCSEFTGYRDYVIAVLPQLKELDGVEILISDRIRAEQKFDLLKYEILDQERAYKVFRERQKKNFVPHFNNLDEPLDNDELNKFWQEKSDNTPEVKTELALVSRKSRDKGTNKDLLKKDKRLIKLFNDKGEPICINQGRIPFTLTDDDDNNYVLDVSVYRYLDTNLLDVDVQPKYVRVTIKKKIFQLALIEEVYPDKSTARRSQTTGHLVVTMPKVYDVLRPKKKQNNDLSKSNVKEKKLNPYLEFENNDDMDFSKIMEKSKTLNKSKIVVDESEVPPLEDIDDS